MKRKAALLVLSCGALLNATDRLDDVLSPGPPPLTRTAMNKVLNLVEWALDARLTANERLLFEKAEIEQWSQPDSAARQNLPTLVKTEELVETLPPTQKEEFRRQIQQTFLETLRKTPDQPGSKLLLAAYDRAHVLDIRNGGNLPNPPAQPVASQPVTSSGRVPGELVGEWTSMHTSSIGFQNTTTGAWAAPSGNGMLYKIFADGRFQSSALIQSSMYNCTMTVNAFEEGTVEVQGNTIVFHSKGGTLDSKDNCNQKFNYQKPLPAKDTTYNWRLQRDQWGVAFCTVRPGVKEECAYRK